MTRGPQQVFHPHSFLPSSLAGGFQKGRSSFWPLSSHHLTPSRTKVHSVFGCLSVAEIPREKDKTEKGGPFLGNSPSSWHLQRDEAMPYAPVLDAGWLKASREAPMVAFSSVLISPLHRRLVPGIQVAPGVPRGISTWVTVSDAAGSLALPFHRSGIRVLFPKEH